MQQCFSVLLLQKGSQEFRPSARLVENDLITYSFDVKLHLLAELQQFQELGQKNDVRQLEPSLLLSLLFKLNFPRTTISID